MAIVMNNHDRSDIEMSIEEFWRERSVNRTLRVLETTQQRSRDELYHLINHIAQFVLPVQFPEHSTVEYGEIMQEALSRLGDEAFANWVLAVFNNQKP